MENGVWSFVYLDIRGPELLIPPTYDYPHEVTVVVPRFFFLSPLDSSLHHTQLIQAHLHDETHKQVRICVPFSIMHSADTNAKKMARFLCMHSP